MLFMCDAKNLTYFRGPLCLSPGSGHKDELCMILATLHKELGDITVTITTPQKLDMS